MPMRHFPLATPFLTLLILFAFTFHSKTVHAITLGGYHATCARKVDQYIDSRTKEFRNELNDPNARRLSVRQGIQHLDVIRSMKTARNANVENDAIDFEMT